MIVTVFRSRLRADAGEEYQQWAARVSDLARSMPGYVSHKAFTAADGERLTLVEFESEAHVRAWAVHPVHAQAKQLGREHFYESFQLQVCEVLRQSSFTSSEASAD